MRVNIKDHNGICKSAIYSVTRAEVAGAEEGFDWSFSFSYANGQANVYAWVVLEGVEDAVELIISEDHNITHEGVVKFWEGLSKNVFKQAAFVRGELPAAIAAWREAHPPLEDRLSLAKVRIGQYDVGGQGAAKAIVADLLVDGEVICEVMEWLDDDSVSKDHHLSSTDDHLAAVAKATWDVGYQDFDSIVRSRVHDLLEQALEQHSRVAA